MSDDRILRRRLDGALRLLSQISVERTSVGDLIAILGDPIAPARVIGALAQMGHRPVAIDERSEWFIYEVPAGLLAPADEPADQPARSPALELKIDVARASLAERGNRSPSPEEIHEEICRLFTGGADPDEFIEALDAGTRRAPAHLYDWQRDLSACADFGQAQVVSAPEQRLIADFRVFLDGVSASDFADAA